MQSPPSDSWSLLKASHKFLILLESKFRFDDTVSGASCRQTPLVSSIGAVVTESLLDVFWFWGALVASLCVVLFSCRGCRRA